MGERKRIDLQPGAPFVIEFEGHRYRWSDCYKLAEIAFMAASVFDAVLKTRDKKFIRLVTVSDDEDIGAHGIHKGWYVARSLTEAEAMKWREASYAGDWVTTVS